MPTEAASTSDPVRPQGCRICAEPPTVRIPKGTSGITSPETGKGTAFDETAKVVARTQIFRHGKPKNFNLKQIEVKAG